MYQQTHLRGIYCILFSHFLSFSIFFLLLGFYIHCLQPNASDALLKDSYLSEEVTMAQMSPGDRRCWEMLSLTGQGADMIGKGRPVEGKTGSCVNSHPHLRNKEAEV